MYSTNFVLASASPARLKTLKAAGLYPTVHISSVDERKIEQAHPEATSAHLALILARAKAEKVAHERNNPEEVILGCDSIFEHQGHCLGKPHTAEKARERITALSNSQGILHTGHWLCYGQHSTGVTTSASVFFDTISAEEIEAYIATQEPLEVAGAFTLDGRGAAFISKIQGDPHTVVGIGINTVRNLLKDVGLNITHFWA